MSVQAITNTTIILLSAPPYPIHHRRFFVGTNSILQALAEIQRAFRNRLRNRLLFFDFFNMAFTQTQYAVCDNHYVCPEIGGKMRMIGPVGKRIVEAMFNGICPSDKEVQKESSIQV